LHTLFYVYLLIGSFAAGFSWSALTASDEPEFDRIDIGCFFMVVFMALMWPLMGIQLGYVYIKGDSK